MNDRQKLEVLLSGEQLVRTINKNKFYIKLTDDGHLVMKGVAGEDEHVGVWTVFTDFGLPAKGGKGVQRQQRKTNKEGRPSKVQGKDVHNQELHP